MQKNSPFTWFLYWKLPIDTRVGVKYFSKSSTSTFHICKYKFKCSKYLEGIKYSFIQVQVKYKYFGNKQQHFPLPPNRLYYSQDIILLGSCCNGNFVGNIYKHIFNWKYLYV